MFKRPARNRKVPNYRLSSDCFSNEDDTKQSDQSKRHVPIYLQDVHEFHVPKKKDPFEFVPEPPRSKRVRDSDSECSFFDESMHRVLQRIRAKMEKKKKAAIKPTKKQPTTKKPMPARNQVTSTNGTVEHTMERIKQKLAVKQVNPGKNATIENPSEGLVNNVQEYDCVDSCRNENFAKSGTSALNSSSGNVQIVRNVLLASNRNCGKNIYFYTTLELNEQKMRSISMNRS